MLTWLKKVFMLFIFVLGFLYLVTFLVSLLIFFLAKPQIYNNVMDLPQAQVVVIPGAAVFQDETMSPVLEDRAKKALEVYFSGKVSKVLISGDNSIIQYNELDPVREYLVAKGIPASDIFQDHAGFDTYSTVYRARDIFQVSSIIVSSQGFHLPRSVFISKALGVKAYGIKTETNKVKTKNYLRESLARVKALLDVLTGRSPKFLGDPIPITGVQTF